MFVIVKGQKWLKAHPWDLLLMLGIGLVGLWTGLWASVIILDDAMITFRVAENLAYGRGFVYNIGERVQVTTTPLYTIILAMGTWPFGAATHAALILNLCLSASIPMLAYDLGRRLSGRITGLGGALLLNFMPLLVVAFSMESYLYVALILVSIDAYVMKHYRLAGILAGITAITRGDAVLLGASMLTYDFLAHRRLRWSLIIPAMVIPAGWYLFAVLYYGSPFPATLNAKTAQGEFNWLGQHFLSGFSNYWHDWIDDYGPRFYLFLPLVSLGLLSAIWTDRRWLILLGQNILYIATFVGLGVTFAEWYYAPLMPAVALFTAHGIHLLANSVGVLAGSINPPHTQTGITPVSLSKSTAFSPRRSRFNQIASITLTTILIFTLLDTLYPVTRDIIAANPDWKARVYPDTARWIAQNTSTSATLATIDIGHLGYWSGRQIIDIVGLAQPDVASHIARGDFGYALRHYQPDMILIGALWLPEVQNKDWFQTAYVPRQFFRFKALDEPLILFTRRDGVKVEDKTVPAAKIQPLDIDFNRQIALTGYHINQPLMPSGRLHLTLYWQVKAAIEVDFAVFVQLIDTQGKIWSQGDSKPQRGYYTTPHWQPGEQITDSYTLPLSPQLPPGSYDIVLGFYELTSGNRLQILDEAGQFKSDHVRLRDLHIQ